jgi:hypothetical protein
MAVGGHRHAPAALPPERPGNHCIGGCFYLNAPKSSSSSSSSQQATGPPVDPLQSHTSRSLFNGLPRFLLPFGVQTQIFHLCLSVRGLFYFQNSLFISVNKDKTQIFHISAPFHSKKTVGWVTVALKG